MPAPDTPTDPLLIWPRCQHRWSHLNHKSVKYLVTSSQLWLTCYLTTLITSINKQTLWLFNKPSHILKHAWTGCYDILLWLTAVCMINGLNCLCEHSLKQYVNRHAMDKHREAVHVNQTKGQSKQTGYHSWKVKSCLSTQRLSTHGPLRCMCSFSCSKVNQRLMK